MTDTVAFGAVWLPGNEYPRDYIESVKNKLEDISVLGFFIKGYVVAKKPLAVFILEPTIPFPPLVGAALCVAAFLASPWTFVKVIAAIGGSLTFALWLVTSPIFWRFIMRVGLRKQGGNGPSVWLSASEVVAEVLK